MEIILCSILFQKILCNLRFQLYSRNMWFVEKICLQGCFIPASHRVSLKEIKKNSESPSNDSVWATLCFQEPGCDTGWQAVLPVQKLLRQPASAISCSSMKLFPTSSRPCGEPARPSPPRRPCRFCCCFLSSQVWTTATLFWLVSLHVPFMQLIQNAAAWLIFNLLNTTLLLPHVAVGTRVVS